MLKKLPISKNVLQGHNFLCRFFQIGNLVSVHNILSEGMIYLSFADNFLVWIFSKTYLPISAPVFKPERFPVR